MSNRSRVRNAQAAAANGGGEVGLDKLQKLWRNASEEEQARFANWVQEQLQRAKKAAYEAEVYGEG